MAWFEMKKFSFTKLHKPMEPLLQISYGEEKGIFRCYVTRSLCEGVSISTSRCIALSQVLTRELSHYAAIDSVFHVLPSSSPHDVFSPQSPTCNSVFTGTHTLTKMRIVPFLRHRHPTCAYFKVRVYDYFLEWIIIMFERDQNVRMNVKILEYIY